MRKVKLSEFRSFVRGVLAEADMRRNPELTGRTAYDPIKKEMYVEWDDGDKKVVAVYTVTEEDNEETPWFDYNGDNKADKNPQKLTWLKSEESFPGGLKIVTADTAIKAAQEYKRLNPSTDIASVNLLNRASRTPGLVNTAANQKLEKAAGGIEKARPDFYKRKAAAKSVKAATPASAASTPAAPSTPADAATGAGSRAGISSSPIKSSVRVKKGEYGFTLKFNNTSRGPITIFVYLLTDTQAQGLGMPADKLVPGAKDPVEDAVYLGRIKAAAGAQMNIENLFTDPPFSDAATEYPNMSYIFLRYYRGSVDKVEEINPGRVAATSLSKLYKDTTK